MRQLSPLDAAFLYFETPRSPMHIGGVYIFEGQFTYKQFLAHVSSRLDIASIFTERLAEVPLDIDLPYWVKDPDFDVELHCPRLGLIAPYNLDALMTMAADIFSRPLDRSRPLWEAHFVEGLDKVKGVQKGSFAIIFKIHHCAVDGVSGEEILAALLDIEPGAKREVKKARRAKKDKKERVPFEIELLGKSVISAFQTRNQFAKFGMESAKFLGKSVFQRLRQGKQAPPALFSAPPTLFNDRISPHRVFTGVQLPLKNIKEIKKPYAGVTVNDVILAVVSGALKKYLEGHDCHPEKSLTVMVPVSVRNRKQKKSLGNQVSSMLVSLESLEEDSLKRLQAIHEHTEQAKAFQKALHLESLAEFVPSLLQTLVARIYSRVRFSQKKRPAFNLVVTNIPGPQFPLYFDTAKLHSQYGMAPIVDGMGLILVVMSYNGNVGIGITACREMMPDAKLLAKYLDDELHALHRKVVRKDSVAKKANPEKKMQDNPPLA